MRKVQAGKKLRHDNRFAKLLSNKVEKGKKGSRYLMYEYATPAPPSRFRSLALPIRGRPKGATTAVLDKTVPKGAVGGTTWSFTPKKQSRVPLRTSPESALPRTHLSDIHEGNRVGGKIVDYLPVSSTNFRKGTLVNFPKGSSPVDDYLYRRQAAKVLLLQKGIKVPPSTQGLSLGQYSTSAKRALRGLGPGSRQAKKIRGSKKY